jgi:hypothetical protein
VRNLWRRKQAFTRAVDRTLIPQLSDTQVWKQLFQKGFRLRAQMNGKLKKKKQNYTV